MSRKTRRNNKPCSDKGPQAQVETHGGPTQERPAGEPDMEPDVDSPSHNAETPDLGLDETEVLAGQLSEDVAEIIERLKAERDEAVAGRTRALADFVNFQKRAVESERRALSRGACNVVTSLLPVLDNFELAVTQNLSQLTMEQFVDGVKVVNDQLYGVLQSLGVQKIEPQAGDEFDPEMHEAMFRQEAEGFALNTIVTVLQPGYSLGDVVLRPAKVAVAEG